MNIAFLMTLLGGGETNLHQTSFEWEISSRPELQEPITRQAKNDIYEWLKEWPNVNIDDYPDLV